MVVAYVTLRQSETPLRLQGRTAAAANLVFNVPQVLMSVLAAAVVGLVDYRLLILGTAIACVLSMIPVLRSPGRRAGRMTIPEFTERVRPAKMDE